VTRRGCRYCLRGPHAAGGPRAGDLGCHAQNITLHASRTTKAAYTAVKHCSVSALNITLHWPLASRPPVIAGRSTSHWAIKHACHSVLLSLLRIANRYALPTCKCRYWITRSDNQLDTNPRLWSFFVNAQLALSWSFADNFPHRPAVGASSPSSFLRLPDQDLIILHTNMWVESEVERSRTQRIEQVMVTVQKSAIWHCDAYSEYIKQESRAIARKLRDAAAVLFGLKFADNIHYNKFKSLRAAKLRKPVFRAPDIPPQNRI